MKKALWPLLVLFIGTLFLLPAEPAAANGSQLLYWDDEMTSTREVFGANAIVAIRFGRMANIFECQGDGIDDPPYPLTDIYVVKAGQYTWGDEIHDINGPPNTIQADLVGGIFDYAAIAEAAPSGNLMPGQYSVIYDECQNGKLDQRDDFLLENAFEIKFDVNAPDLQWPARNEAKLRFKQQEQQIRNSAKYRQVVRHISTVKELNKELNKLPLASKRIAALRAKLPRNLRRIESTEGIDDLYSLFFLADYFKALAADPPDPQFKQPTPLVARNLSETVNADPIDVAAVRWDNAAQNAGAIAKALLHSVERYQGRHRARRRVSANACPRRPALPRRPERRAERFRQHSGGLWRGDQRGCGRP